MESLSQCTVLQQRDISVLVGPRVVKRNQAMKNNSVNLKNPLHWSFESRNSQYAKGLVMQTAFT
jgi:hypothetical protein